MRTLALCTITAILLQASCAWAAPNNACEYWNDMSVRERATVFTCYNDGVWRGCTAKTDTGSAAHSAPAKCIEKYTFPPDLLSNIDITTRACARITGGKFGFGVLLDCLNMLRRNEITLDDINACVGNK